MAKKSKKQLEHMVQNAVHRVRQGIKRSENSDCCSPEQKLENMIWDEYYRKKYEQENK